MSNLYKHVRKNVYLFLRCGHCNFYTLVIIYFICKFGLE